MDNLMSKKEVKRSRILDRLKEGKISQQEAAQQVDISTRQVRRLAKRYQREGLVGLISKKRGYASNRWLARSWSSCTACIYPSKAPGNS
jgi:transposase